MHNDALPVGRCFCEFSIAVDKGIENHLFEMLTHILHHLAGQTETVIVHCDEQSFDGEFGIEASLHNAHGVQQLAETLEGEVFALDGNNHRVGSREGINSDEAQRGGAVDDDVVIVVPKRFEHAGKELLAALLVNKLHFSTHEVDTRRQEVEIGGIGLDNNLVGISLTEDTVVNTFLQLVGVEAETGAPSSREPLVRH